jgi:hypothetical protein
MYDKSQNPEITSAVLCLCLPFQSIPQHSISFETGFLSIISQTYLISIQPIHGGKTQN